MLELYHPGVARIDCRLCQERLYDLETGTPQTFTVRGEVRFYDKAAIPDHKPPCRTHLGCPKGSPEEAHLYELSLQNWKVVDLWKAVRATHGRCLSEAQSQDPLTTHLLTIVEEVMREKEQREMAKQNARQIGKEVRHGG